MTLDELLSRWRQAAASADFNQERVKGHAFERLCQVFLTHDPTQRNQLEPPVPYSQWAREHGRSQVDLGIDLVAKDRITDGWCAIQCKFYAKTKSVAKKEIDSFIAASATGDFTRRMVIDTTGRPWSKYAEDITCNLQVPITRVTLQQLRESSIDWAKYIGDDVIETRPPKTPRPHQQEAIQNVVEGLKTKHTRGKLIMACGTGKTYTALCIAEQLAGQGKRVLYLVPSLALMAQTVREWSQDAQVPLRSYAVCSDSQVGRRRRRNDDRIDINPVDLAFPATTDAGQLAHKARTEAADQMTVVFATYHSLPVIGQAQQAFDLPDFDLIICDEAHRTAGASIKGEPESPFVQVHDQTNIRGDRRLYMTATPKVYAASARDKANQVQAALYSMEDESDFGPVLYELRFGDAIEKDLLSDYKVIILTVPEGLVAKSVHKALSEGELDLTDAGKLLGCWRALAKADESEFPEDDRLPMRRAIAYCRDIKSSKQIEAMFGRLANEYRASEAASIEGEMPAHEVAAKHVDGTFNALQRGERLSWLESVQASDERCHILTNARCLSEGVDVPSLDAILFMHPRKSQIDVVQAVGRVMRKAPGKQMGYVVLPVVIPSGDDPQAALDRKAFRVVWQMLNAIRSHDERFEAILNLVEEGEAGDRLGIVTLSDYHTKSESDSILDGRDALDPEPTPPNGQLEFDFPAAIRAKILEKCGSRRYWEEWAADVADIARRHIERIKGLVQRHQAAQDVFKEFMVELRDDLNEGISESDAIEMLAQHMITRPVFEALHGDARFVDHNPVSKGMQKVLQVLEGEHIDREAQGLQDFYASVARRAKAATTPLARQKIVIELYDKFFRNAFPKTADRLGIVYTPVELVDFILHSVEAILQSEFGQSLSSEGVEILDPFTGTGTFITRIIQNGLISRAQLPGKYANEMHANEIMLLAYYIAAVNIEAAYHAEVQADAYERFPGIILTDTFDLQDRPDLIANFLPENSDQRQRQKDAAIRVIVSNPPWSVGQKSQNDAAQNQKYPELDERIRSSFATHGSAASVRNLYDSYVRAIRWASDRIGKSGVIGFVTNAGWLDSNAMDGMRQCLAKEFTGIYVLHLRGNQRTQGERSRQEGGKVFGGGSRAPVAVTLLVKNPAQKTRRILIHDIGDYLNREEKLQKVTAFKDIHGVSTTGGWTEIKPDRYHDWLNQRDPGFGEFMALGDKAASAKIFENHSLGVATARDAWCYNYSESGLRTNINRMIKAYNEERTRIHDLDLEANADPADLVDNDPKKIKWSRGLKNDLRRNKPLQIDEGQIVASQYRPFTRQYLYFSRRLNDMVYQIPRLFPHSEAENRVICVTGRGESDDFSCLMVKDIPNLHLIASGQCFPRWLYAKPDDDALFGNSLETDAHGYVRYCAITNAALTALGDDYTADDLFHYIYGVLHIPAYRQNFAANLKKELPRIPPPDDDAQFIALAEAGRKLAELHVDYESAQEWPLEFEKGGWEPKAEHWFYVSKPMRHPKQGKSQDRTRILYNDHITVCDIPSQAYDYKVNGKPAIAWVMERQCVKTDKNSGIITDANRFAVDTMHDSAYPLKLLAKVIYISIETLKIVDALPEPIWAVTEHQ